MLDEAHFFRACLYVVLNPVAAGLCDHPGAWRHCSYAATAEGDRDAYADGEERLLCMFGDTPREARDRYAAHVGRMSEAIREQRVPQGRALWEAVSRVGVPRRPKVPG